MIKKTFRSKEERMEQANDENKNLVKKKEFANKKTTKEVKFFMYTIRLGNNGCTM